jgi:hypothetical protein
MQGGLQSVVGWNAHALPTHRDAQTLTVSLIVSQIETTIPKEPNSSLLSADSSQPLWRFAFPIVKTIGPGGVGLMTGFKALLNGRGDEQLVDGVTRRAEKRNAEAPIWHRLIVRKSLGLCCEGEYIALSDMS